MEVLYPRGEKGTALLAKTQIGKSCSQSRKPGLLAKKPGTPHVSAGVGQLRFDLWGIHLSDKYEKDPMLPARVNWKCFLHSQDETKVLPVGSFHSC